MMEWWRALVAAVLPFFGFAANSATFYVDYENGNDAASGTAPTAAWRHAPGDPAAVGRSGSARLIAGDTVRFRGGVAYRGTITVNGSGTAERPIVFTGAGYGTAPAVIDGSDPVDGAVPCPSAAACGGAANWQTLRLVSFSPPQASAFIKLYDDKGPLTEAQYPVPDDPFFADDIDGFVASPLDEKAGIEAGRLRSPEFAKLLRGRPAGTLLIWVAGNQVARRPITGVEGDVLTFDPAGLRLYDDRPGRFALLGFAGAVSRPGHYAVIAPGRAVVLPRGSGGLTIGSGRGGIDLDGQSGVTVTGLTFAHQTGAAGKQREGLAIFQTGKASTSIAITENRFVDSAMWNGQGAITLRNVDGAVVRDNVISGIERGSGLRVGGNVRNLTVAGNRIDRVGRTGIAFLGVANGSITDNVMTGLRGIHGNGISLYLANRDISVAGNTVTETTRPMTFHGDKSRAAPGDHNFVIERNVFIATDDGQAALTSWGASTRGVIIRNNVLVAPKAGLLLNGTDTGVVVEANYTSGLITNTAKGQQPGWRVGKNRDAPKTLRAAAVNRQLCSAAGIVSGAKLGTVAC